YKSKELLAQFGLSIPSGKRARTPSEAEACCASLRATKYVVKAQIAAGGRGPAGGILFAATPSSVHDEAAKLLGTRLVTDQTSPQGETVNLVYVEAALTLAAQFYIALVIDPESGAPLLLASAEGGTAFEQRAHQNENAVVQAKLPATNPEAAIEESLARVGIDDAAATKQVAAALKAFNENDMTLLEINPFARTNDDAWVVIDAKIVLDPAAAFRHPEFESLLADPSGPEIENEAQRSNINFVALSGNLGVVVNGAGLGLATNDMIVDADGTPANFMDIRTTATSFDIARGVQLLLEDRAVKAILLNVHGGGMTVCDTVAEGVAFAYTRSDRKVPCIARLAGVNADWGLQILKDRKVPVEARDDMKAAVARAVELAGAA
ncbi:MAG: ATP-grasp domain-containing protein, partial [Pseudomonadota bacterium]